MKKIFNNIYCKINKHRSPFFMLAVAMMVLLYIIFCEIDIVSPGQGVITGGNDKVVIKSPSSGFINSFNLQEGDQIEKGTVLFSYTNLDYTYKGITLKDLIGFNNKKIKFLQQDSKLLESLLSAPTIPIDIDRETTSEFGSLSYYSFREENDALQMEEQSLQEKEKLLNEEVKLREKQIANLQRKDNLLRKGGASDIDILTNSADIERQKTDLINVKINFLTLKSDISNAKSKFKVKLYEQIHSIRDKISDLERGNIENRGELELMNDKVSTNSVTSPFSGKVLKIENNLKEGSFIEQYQPVVTVKQDNIGRVIEAKFDTKYRPYLYEGADVKISVNSTAFKKNFTGKISKISADSFVDNVRNNSEQRYYSVTIDTFEEIEPSLLPEGIEVNVFATSKKVSIFEYMIATLKSNLVFNVW